MARRLRNQRPSGPLVLSNFTCTAEAADLKVIDSALRKRYGSKQMVWTMICHELAIDLADDPISVIDMYRERFERRVSQAQAEIDREARR